MASRKRLTDAELKQLAQDVFNNKVFTTAQMEKFEMDNLGMVFMPLLMMNKEQRDELVKEKPYMLYGYMSQASPLACNGLPMFMSFKYLTKSEATKLKKFYKEFENLMKGWKGEGK